jgi:hypothetical protein
VIWYRLPVTGDRLNWAALTLATVLRGEVPVARVGVEVTWPEPGLAEIVVVNSGQTTEPVPGAFDLRWAAEERLLASDGLGGFRLEMRSATTQASLRAAEVPVAGLLAPGRRLKIAWLRFPHEISLDVLPTPVP